MLYENQVPPPRTDSTVPVTFCEQFLSNHPIEPMRYRSRLCVDRTLSAVDGEDWAVQL